jgi:hypothetical protein
LVGHLNNKILSKYEICISGRHFIAVNTSISTQLLRSIRKLKVAILDVLIIKFLLNFFSQIAVAVDTFYLDPCIYAKEKWQLLTLCCIGFLAQPVLEEIGAVFCSPGVPALAMRTFLAIPLMLEQADLRSCKYSFYIRK